MPSELFALKWNNHNSAFVNTLSKLRYKDKYCDATLACDGMYYPVHKFVLSTCSEYFEEIFERIECKHPVIILKDVNMDDVEALLNYMYLGEVNVPQETLERLIKNADNLKIKGLAVPDIQTEVPLYRNKEKRPLVDDRNPLAKRCKPDDSIGLESEGNNQYDAEHQEKKCSENSFSSLGVNISGENKFDDGLQSSSMMGDSPRNQVSDSGNQPQFEVEEMEHFMNMSAQFPQISIKTDNSSNASGSNGFEKKCSNLLEKIIVEQEQLKHQINLMNKQLIKSSPTLTSTSTSSSSPPEEIEFSFQFPIQDLTQFEFMNEQLKNVDAREKFAVWLYQVAGSTVSDSINLWLKTIFDDHFFTKHMNWSGKLSSKSLQTSPKASLKDSAFYSAMLYGLQKAHDQTNLNEIGNYVRLYCRKAYDRLYRKESRKPKMEHLE